MFLNASSIGYLNKISEKKTIRKPSTVIRGTINNNKNNNIIVIDRENNKNRQNKSLDKVRKRRLEKKRTDLYHHRDGCNEDE